MDTPSMKEVVDRCRRMETRLTRFLETQGFDTQVKRAEWRAQDSTVIVPSLSTPLREVMAMIPREWSASNAIRVEHKGVHVAWVFVP